MPFISAALHFWWIVPIVLAVVFWKAFMHVFGVVFVPDNQIGIVIKKFGLGGSSHLPDGHIIALKGEAGIQADTLAPGMHLFLWPWQYQVVIEGMTEIPEGKLGVVEAIDGVQIPSGRVLGKKVDCNSFQDARSFLEGGGMRGPQMEIIRPGIYRINTNIFSIKSFPATAIDSDKVGLVTTFDGAPLPSGEIAGEEITGHHSFQDGQAFVDGGGFKGRQEQVLLAGTYFLNPRFAEVEEVDLVNIPIGYVGVVISFVGKAHAAESGAQGHANIVEKGEKGVWNKPLDPGRYPVNSYVQRVEPVPTTNIVLNWAVAKSEAHKLDASLSTITVRSKDGFPFNLDVSQIIHIAPADAPMVIARFGNMQNLVAQVLEPTVGNYVRNSAQAYTVLDFLAARSERQAEAKTAMETALKSYSIQAVDTLIGDISPPAELMKPLTDRKVAEQMTITFDQRRLSEEARQALEEAKAMADTRAQVVAASRSVEVAELTAQAHVKEAEGEAKSKTINAEADANVLVTVGNAQAEKTLAVGNAEAAVLQAKVDAVGPEKYAAMQITDFLSKNQMQLTPQVVVGGGNDGKSGSIADAMIGFMLAQNVRENGEWHEEAESSKGGSQ